MSEGLEALKELRYRITNFNGKFNDYNKIMNIIEQELKALEIITNKLDVLGVLGYVFAKEEYELLKEVLK